MGKSLYVVLYVVLFLMATLLFAQSERANLTGTVSDPSGTAIAGATVNATHLATNTTATVRTTAGGDYNVPNLSPGRYTVEISAPGFKRFLQADVTLTAAGTVRLDAQLTLAHTCRSGLPLGKSRSRNPQLPASSMKYSGSTSTRLSSPEER
jgi:hypothetical protein